MLDGQQVAGTDNVDRVLSTEVREHEENTDPGMMVPTDHSLLPSFTEL